MYLKSLTLKGFKSFADRTRMVFDPGLTVVVGPNGSGKSNISDAILWVLGEQSAKHLRGSAMEDVIFAGSSGRAAVSVAEVDLVLDNADHTLPIDFAEVAITRRMYRSGESEYLVNASPARLMDVQDILHDSGLGRQTHSIISQGKLDAVLMSRPEERRALIEEAAGISKHKRRRERALRRLASMDEYLRRAQDLERTLARQVRPLERQAERARQYDAASARLGELKVTLAVDDLRRLRARWAEAEDAEKDAGALLARAEERVAQRQAELARLQGLLDAKGLFAGSISEQRRRCSSLMDRLDACAGLLDEKARHMGERQAELAEAAERGESRVSDGEGELLEAREADAKSQAELRALEQQKAEADAAVARAKEARRAADAALTRATARIRENQARRDEATVALARARDVQENAREADELACERLAQIDEARLRAESDGKAAADERDRTQTSLAEAREAQAEASGRVEDARTTQADAGARVEERRRALAAAQAARRDADQVLAALDAEVDGLGRVVSGAQDAQPLAALLAADEGVRRACVGRVSDALDVPAELAGLVERLLGQRAGGFVVDGAAELADVARVAEAHGEQGGLACIVSRSNNALPDEGANEGLPGFPLAARLGEAPGMEGVARALLGDVRVVEDVAQALAASASDPRHVYATPAGTCARAGLMVTVGTSGGAAGAISARVRMRELSDARPALAEAARTAEASEVEAERELDQARAAADAAAGDLASRQGELRGAQAEVTRLERALKRAQDEVVRLERAAQAKLSERDQALERRQAQAARAQEARTSAARAQEQIDAADAATRPLEAERAAAQADVDAARRDERAAHEAASDRKAALASARERARYASRRAGELAGQLEEARRELDAARSGLRALARTSARVGPLRASLAALSEAATGWDALLEQRARLAESDSASLRTALVAARADVDSAQQGYTDALNALNDVKVRKGQLDVQVNAAVNAITACPGVVLEEALALPAPDDRPAAEAEAAGLERQLAEMGPVNHVASQEYERLRSQAQYVAGQVEDLRQARASLTKIIAAIDRKMRASFTQTFEAVDANFREIFATLFPGGTGRLELTDPDNPDETGVEVIAQPQGKRVTKMSLLSGGERSLAALGLLFAVYKTRTVPFYVLDEVEAALDDSNLDRLLQAIDMLRSYTQLIVISHQRRTMERADVLYGVSMQADGVSKVVSQRLGEGTAAARASRTR